MSHSLSLILKLAAIDGEGRSEGRDILGLSARSVPHFVNGEM